MSSGVEGTAAQAQHDSSVQRTNDDSIVSKRSAGRLGYVEDSYLRHFVKKAARRAPLINRGYYLRIKAMTDLVTSLLVAMQQKSTSSGVQVLSLGAGYDTLPSRLYTDERFAQVRFFEVDFPDVIRNKTGLVLAEKDDFPFPLAVPSATATTTTITTPVALKEEKEPSTKEEKTEKIGKRKVRKLAKLTKKLGDAEAAAKRFGANGQGNKKEKGSPLSNNLPTEIHADRYHTLGYNLTNTGALLEKLQSFGFNATLPTVVYAECVMQYMDEPDSTRLVQWVSQHLANGIFVAYDQIGPLDSFGGVMQNSLRTRLSPLLGVQRMSCRRALADRAVKAGLSDVRVADFHALSQWLIRGEERTRVDAIEAFDELEEWCEMCDHYCILTGATCVSSFPTLSGSCQLVSDALRPYTPIKHLPPVPPSPSPSPLQGGLGDSVAVVEQVVGRHSFEGWGHAAVYEPALHAIVSVGGYTTVGKQRHTRTNAVSIHSLTHGELKYGHCETTAEELQGNRSTVPAFMYHSMVRLSACQYFVFGGREGPESPSNKAFLLTLNPTLESYSWREIASNTGAPPKRYRHQMALLDDGSHVSESNPPHGGGTGTCTYQMVLHGGVDAKGQVLSDMWSATLALPLEGGIVAPTGTCTVQWTQQQQGQTLLPRASATLTTLKNGLCLLVGGMVSKDDCASNELFFIHRDTATGSLAFAPSKERLFDAVFSHGATLVQGMSPPTLAVTGGSCFSPRDTRQPFFQDITFVELDLEGECVRKVTRAPPRTDGDTTWTRMHVFSPAPHSLVLFGGGFTCFSFGTFSNKMSFVRLSEEALPLPSLAALEEEIRDRSTGANAAVRAHPSSASFHYPSLPSEGPERALTPETWTRAVALRRPHFFHAVDFGPCVDRWKDPSYLSGGEDGKTVVSIHVSKDTNLDFVHKNFSFRHLPFAELVQHIFGESPEVEGSPREKEAWYFRSVGKNMRTDRSDVFNDFLSLGKDFVVPKAAQTPCTSYISDSNIHQSCFRINEGGMRLWTHYDVLDNILCQIVGRKRVVLFPPSQFHNLYVEGSSSPVLDVDQPDLHRYPRFAEALPYGIEIVLHPGDMLFVPSHWYHHIQALDPCISINIFYENLPRECYDAKDLYGNKDLPPTVSARERAVAHVLKELEELPPSLRSHTLGQLLSDLSALQREKFQF